MTVAPKNVKRFESVMQGNSIKRLGFVTESPAVVVRARDDKTVIDTTIEAMQNAYERTFKEY